MDTCFICKKMMVPQVPAVCKNASLQRAWENIKFAQAKSQEVRVADFDVQLFEKEKICLLKECYDPEHPKVSLTNSIETAIVVACIKHNLCPVIWTFVEYSNAGNGKNSYHEYDLVLLNNDHIDWKYIWHNEYTEEKEPYSDDLMIRRVDKYRLTG